MKDKINDLLIKMQTGDNCIGETANELFDLCCDIEAKLNKKLEQQKEDIKEWLISEDFEGLAERI